MINIITSTSSDHFKYLTNFSNRWYFLTPVRETGTPLDLLSLIAACTSDLSILDFVSEQTKQAVAAKAASRTAISFYGALTIQVIGANKKIRDSVVTTILPYILYGLKSDDIDYQVAPMTQLSLTTHRLPLT